MKKETYKQAQARLLTELASKGWITKPALKVPQAISNLNPGIHLFFRTQAVYLNEHSLWIDIRDMTVSDLIDAANHRYSD